MYEEERDEMVARAFPVMSKLFQRCATALTQSVASTGVLLLVRHSSIHRLNRLFPEFWAAKIFFSRIF